MRHDDYYAAIIIILTMTFWAFVIKNPIVRVYLDYSHEKLVDLGRKNESSCDTCDLYVCQP